MNRGTEPVRVINTVNIFLLNRDFNSYSISFIAVVLLFITALIFLEKGKNLEDQIFTTNTEFAVISDAESETRQEETSLITAYSALSLEIILLQIIIIISVARILGIFFRKINQPSVVGEIIAGILLGPSIFGYFFPGAYEFLFNPESLQILFYLSEIGLILYMFIIGMELDWDLARSGVKTSIGISVFSIALPFVFGIILAYFLFNSTLVHKKIDFLFFALFIGISLSVTAFPVLARILQEKNLSKIKIGSIALTSAAISDLFAWSILAVIVAAVKAETVISALITLIHAVIFVSFMLLFVRPMLKKISSRYSTKESLTKSVIAGIFIFLLASSIVTEIIGIHALFGAFLAGAVIPADKPIKSILIDKIEDISIVIFLPLFFAYSGLRTEIGFINNPYMILLCIAAIFAATSGKFLGSLIPARFSGLSWKDSISTGILMNTKGLMELIVLNIGYDTGILSPEIFLILFIMAVVTTFMTGPGISIMQRFYKENEPADSIKSQYPSLLLAFAKQDTALNLIRIASLLFSNKHINISGIHINRNDIMTENSALKKLERSMNAVKRNAEALKIKISMSYRFTDNVERGIAEHAKNINADFLLLGSSKNLFSKNILRRRFMKSLKKTSCNIGILISRAKISPEHLYILRESDEDMRIDLLLKKFNPSKTLKIRTVSLRHFLNSEMISGNSIDKILSHRIEKDSLIIMDIKHWENLNFYQSDMKNYSFLILIQAK